MMPKLASVLALSALGLTLTACAARAVGEAEATLEVRNEAASAVTVYVLRGGGRSRLGRVPAGSTTTFPLGPGLLTGPRLRLLVERGARTPVVDEVFVQPGDHVLLVVPAYR